jgi:hypothetical protein
MLRTRIPILITAFVGSFMILHYFFTPAWIKSVAEELKLWGVITMAFAIVLGVMNIARVNLKIVMERKRDWGYKLILLVVMFSMMCAGGYQWHLNFRAKAVQGTYEKAMGAATDPANAASQAELEKTKAELATAELAVKHSPFNYAFDYVLLPLSATIFALLAFYVASAAFRAFRARNVQSALLLITAVLVMIGRVPVGKAIWGGFPLLQDWIMIWPNTAGQRAILIGAAIGMIATGIRVIFGIERPYLKG